jgi:hypothetical protein
MNFKKVFGHNEYFISVSFLYMEGGDKLYSFRNNQILDYHMSNMTSFNATDQPQNNKEIVPTLILTFCTGCNSKISTMYYPTKGFINPMVPNNICCKKCHLSIFNNNKINISSIPLYFRHMNNYWTFCSCKNKISYNNYPNSICCIQTHSNLKSVFNLNPVLNEPTMSLPIDNPPTSQNTRTLEHPTIFSFPDIESDTITQSNDLKHITVENMRQLTPINFIGYDAQGVKITNKDYYQKTPGRTQVDHYKEHKKPTELCSASNNQCMDNLCEYEPFIKNKKNIPTKTTIQSFK